MSERNKETAYTSDGFSSWKKAPQCFDKHQETKCHKSAASMEVVVTKCGNVGEMLSQGVLESHKRERKYLMDLMRSLVFLAKQGIVIQEYPFRPFR